MKENRDERTVNRIEIVALKYVDGRPRRRRPRRNGEREKAAIRRGAREVKMRLRTYTITDD